MTQEEWIQLLSYQGVYEIENKMNIIYNFNDFKEENSSWPSAIICNCSVF